MPNEKREKGEKKKQTERLRLREQRGGLNGSMVPVKSFFIPEPKSKRRGKKITKVHSARG